MSNAWPDDFTIPNVRGDFRDWHQGRPRYALWAIELDEAPVQALLHTAHTQLSDLLLDGYLRQPHVTLGLCGFPCATPQQDDDYGLHHLQAQCQALRAAALPPFPLHLSGLETFHTVPYLQVHDPEARLAAVRAAVATSPLDQSQGRYTPHVTVGLYQGRWPLAAIRQRLQAVSLPHVAVEVRAVSLLTYQASEIGGPLQTLARFDLHSQTVQTVALPLEWGYAG
jgi:2'-5' RNA ligase